MEPIIEFKDFSFQYDSQAEPTLKHLNLQIQPGEKVLIAGPSGSGKSTLLKCLNGLIPQEEPGEVTGECWVAGTELRQASIFDRSFQVSTILQDTDSQFIGLTVGEDVAFALENDGQELDTMQAAVQKWAEELRLTDLLNQAPGDLSGGQKQRVAMAGVLVDGSPILLFDEPLANLDPASGEATMRLIDRLQRESQVTVIIIEHRLEEVLTSPVDRVILINDGTVIADAAPDELVAGTLLAQHGIREPLYIRALKLAGVDLTKLGSLTPFDRLQLPETAKTALQERFVAATGASAAKAEAAPLLELQRVGFRYSPTQPHPLTDVNFTLHQGDFVSIVGQNGAGKTTLVKLICGFLQGEGELKWKGQSLAGDSIKERADKIGYVMQNPNEMISQKQIFDEVALGLRLRQVPEDEVKERVEKVLQVCGLYPFRNWPISALSFGQRKRVTIAAILVLEPELLILDEPTAGQDWRTYTEIMGFLKGLQERGMTIAIITHDMYLMTEYTNRALVFQDGQLVADLPPVDLLLDDQLLAAASLTTTSLVKLARQSQVDDPAAFSRAYLAAVRADKEGEADE